MLTVSVPKLRVRGPRSAEVRPSRVEAWLADLPQANVEDSMQQILQALFVQNRTMLDSSNRLSLMELYLGPVLNIVETFAQSYVTTTFPLTRRQFDLAVSVQHLCEELANGYKVVVNDLITQQVIAKNKADFELAVQRAMDTLSRIVVNSYSIYRPYPEEVWHQLHQLYWISETEETLHTPVADYAASETGGGKNTAYGSYQKAILIGACNPYGLLQGECASLFKLIAQWRSGIQIVAWPQGEKNDRPGEFLINLISDSPPVPLVKVAHTGFDAEKSNSLRMVKSLKVVREVHAILKELGMNSPKSVAGVFPVGRGTNSDLLRRFGRVLGGVNIVRHSTRSGYDREIPLCVGMNSIHFFTNGQRTFHSPDPKLESETETDSTPPGGTAPSEEFFDLTDPAVGILREPEQKVSGPNDLALYSNIHRLFTCSVKDQSASGLCVSIQDRSELRVRVGDLIGLQFPTPNQWRVGVIRWLKNRGEDAFEFGTQLLAPSLLPVAVKRTIDKDAFFQALLLPGNQSLKQPESLLVPRGAYQPGDKLILSRQPAEKIQISPLQVLDRTGSYDQLLIVLPDNAPG